MFEFFYVIAMIGMVLYMTWLVYLVIGKTFADFLHFCFGLWVVTAIGSLSWLCILVLLQQGSM